MLRRMRIEVQKLMHGQAFAKLRTFLLMLAVIGSPTVFAYGQSDKKADSKKNSVSSAAADLAAQNYNRARDLIAVNNWAEAEEKLDYVITEYPNSKYREQAFYWLAYVYKQQGKYQKAILLLNKLINDFPRSAWSDDARSLRAELAAHVGDTEIINESLKSADNEEIKLAGLSSLFQVDPKEGLRRAIEILDSPAVADNINLREAVIVLIGKYGGEETSNVLLNIARTERDSVTRTAAIISLKGRVNESVLRKLVELVLKCDDNTVAETALFVITGQENGRAAGEALAQIVLLADSPDTRKHAVHFLGKLKGGSGIDKLIRLLDAAQDIEVKREILFTLSQTGNPVAQARVFKISRLTDNLGLREEGILSLGRFGDARIIERLIQSYDAEPRDDVKILILLSLGKSKQKNALGKLMSAAQNEKSPVLRKKAAQLLKQRADSEAKK